MPLVKALAVARFPISSTEDADWAVGETRRIPMYLLAKYQAHPTVFTVLDATDNATTAETAVETLLATATAGAKNGSTVTATETEGIVQKTVLTLAAVPITVRDTQQGGGVKIYDFPEGRIAFLGATGSIALTTTSAIASTLNAGVTCNWGVGSTTQANATLATTEQNIIQVANVTSSATINVAGAASTSFGAATALDGTGTAIDAYLNVAVAGATDIDADATVTVSGTITIHWLNLGDV